MVSSDIVELELLNMKNPIKRGKVIELCSVAHEKALTTGDIAARADELQAFGIKALDSFHIALAEHSNVDIFLSTDDKLINLSKRSSLSVRLINPLRWLPEVL